MTNNILEEVGAGEPVAAMPSSDPLLTTNSAGLAVQLIIGEELLEESDAISRALQNALEEYAHD